MILYIYIYIINTIMKEFRDSVIKRQKVFQIGLIITIFVLSYIVLSQLSFTFSSLLWAITFYMTLKPVYINLTEKKNWNRHIAASTLLAFLLIFILIIVFVSYLIVNIKVLPVIENPNDIKIMTYNISQNLKNLIPSSIDLDIVGFISQSIPKIANYFIPFIKNIGVILFDIVMTMIMFYILIINDKYVKKFIENILPFKKERSIAILNRFENLVRGNMVVIPLVAISQGLAGMIGYIIFGFNFSNALMLGFLTAISSVIPVVGTAIVYIPLALYTGALDGNLFNAIGIFLWGFIIIGFVDNMARAVFQRKMSKISEWYTIIGSIVGLQLFGISGLIFGPVLLIMVISLYKMYYHHFGLYRDDNNLDFK